MAKTTYKYTYDDLRDPSNNCIFSTLMQLSEKCGIPYRTMQDIFRKGSIYYERTGLFKIEKRVHYMAKNKVRR